MYESPKVKIAISDLFAVDDSNVSRLGGVMVPYNDSLNHRHATRVYEHMVYWIHKLNLDINDFEFYSMSSFKSGFAAAKDKGIQIINMSLSDTFNGDTEGEELVKEDTLLITSCGNDGVLGETGAARRNAWLAVGAINQSLDPQSYSSHKFGNVITVGIDDVLGRHGTSYAAPMVSIITAEMYRQHYKALGKFPSNPKSVVQWVKFNSHDVFDEGWDIETGYGLLKMPKRWEFKETEYQYDSDSMIIRTVIDGVETVNEKTCIMKPRFISTDFYNANKEVLDKIGFPKWRSIFTVRDLVEPMSLNVSNEGTKVFISEAIV